MEVGIHANIVDLATSQVGETLRQPFDELSESLTGGYGGQIEHLWIDFELSQFQAKNDGSPRCPFRFQKRVSGRSHFGLPPSPDKFNVGHYSVRPDFQLITSIPTEKIIPYALSLIFDSTIVLVEKSKRLGGFNAGLFRNRFVESCQNLGFEISKKTL